MNKDDSLKPPSEEDLPNPDSTDAPESTSDSSADTAPKPKKRGKGKFAFFLLILILAVGGTAYYYELKQSKFRKDLESRLYTLSRAAKDKPNQNAKDLHFLTERFEQSQVQIADAIQRQTQTIEALRQEIDQLKARLDGDTGTAPVEEVPTEPEPPVTGDQEEVIPEPIEPAVADNNEIGGEEAPPPVEEEPTEEQVDVAETGTESAEEIIPAADETPVNEEVDTTSEIEDPEEDSEFQPPEVPTAPEEEPVPEAVIVASQDTETVVTTPPQPVVNQETVQPEGQRSEGEQEYIDFVETTTGKFFRLVKEGSVKLWGYLASLF